MAAARNWSTWWARLFGSGEAGRAAVIDYLSHRYVREKQHAMRYCQHAERMRYPQFRDALSDLAAEERKHAELIAEKIREMGAELPNVVPIHVAHEQNSWYYLRTDLEEEQRCAGELEGELPMLTAEFPDVAQLLGRIEIDGKRHRAQIRDMLTRSDPQASSQANAAARLRSFGSFQAKPNSFGDRTSMTVLAVDGSHFVEQAMRFDVAQAALQQRQVDIFFLGEMHFE
jgi:rubrerythrin